MYSIEQDFSDIQKIPIATDKELLREFDYFNSNLIDTSMPR